VDEPQPRSAEAQERCDSARLDLSLLRSKILVQCMSSMRETNWGCDLAILDLSLLRSKILVQCISSMREIKRREWRSD